ncbi:MAG: helix-turn-helix transcriptional regulator [Methanobacterium sp.]
MSNEILNLYEKVRDDLKFLTASDVRTKIILVLNNGLKKLGDLKDETSLNSSTILHGMSQLEEKNLIIKQSGGYSLSQTGKIVALNLISLIEASTSLGELEKIFLQHEINPIPEYLLESIGSLKNSFVVESTPTDVMKPHTVYAELIQSSTDVKYISSVLLPQKIESFEETLEKGSLQLILTSEILDKWIEIKGRENLKKALLERDFKLWKINSNVKISFTVSETFIALGLFQTDGIYDLHKYLIGEDQDAIRWGNRLFDYYLKQSEKVIL